MILRSRGYELCPVCGQPVESWFDEKLGQVVAYHNGKLYTRVEPILVDCLKLHPEELDRVSKQYPSLFKLYMAKLEKGKKK